MKIHIFSTVVTVILKFDFNVVLFIHLFIVVCAFHYFMYHLLVIYS